MAAKYHPNDLLDSQNSLHFVQSAKRQAATSGKQPNIFSLVKFPETSVERLYQDKCILRMCYMERNLMWR